MGEREIRREVAASNRRFWVVALLLTALIGHILGLG